MKINKSEEKIKQMLKPDHQEQILMLAMMIFGNLSRKAVQPKYRQKRCNAISNQPNVCIDREKCKILEPKLGYPEA
jgi:hypothetical protein